MSPYLRAGRGGAMSVDKPHDLTILSVRAVTRSDVIDGGDTIVLRICRADGHPAAILVPRDVARAMAETLNESVAEAAARVVGRSER